MKIQPYLPLFALGLLFACCKQKKEDSASPALGQTEEAASISYQREEHFLLTDAGDRSSADMTITAKSRWIDPDSVAKPKVIPLRGRPKVVPAHTNVHPVGAPKVVRIPLELTAATPGENGVLLPDTVPAQGIVVPIRRPQSITALPPQMKDEAIYDIQFLDRRHGMLTYQVMSILVDSRGRLWFGTEAGGVSCYDGETFTHYTAEEGLSGNAVYSILEDRRGNLWFATSFGVSCYDGATFTHYLSDKNISQNYVRVILEDRQGNLWFGIRDKGVSRYDPVREDGTGGSFTHYTTEEGLSDRNVTSILEDQQGNLWFGTSGGGVNRFDGKTFTRFTAEEGLSHNNVASILEDQQGNLWFGTRGGGVNRYDGKTFMHYTIEEGLSHNYVSSIWEDHQGNLWFGTENGGVNRFDGKTFTHYTTEEGLSHNRVTSILEDQQGNLWLGTGKGASRYDPYSFSYYSTKEGLSNNWVRSILEDQKGNLWFGTNSGGVSCYDGTNFIHYTAKEGLSSNHIISMLEDHQGNLWFGTDNGLNRYNGEKFIHYTTEEGLSNNGVLSMLKDRQGNLWFGTAGGGASRYDGESFTHYTTEEGLSNNGVRVILEDHQGNLWFGTGNGLNRYDGETFIRYTTEEGLSNNGIMSMLADSRGNLWFGAWEGGMNRFNGETFSHYTTEGGLMHNRIMSILEDVNKNIWICARRGITLLVPSVDESTAIGHSQTDNISREFSQGRRFIFDESDGLKTIEFFRHGNAFYDSNNRLWWGSRYGVAMLGLNHFKLPSEPPGRLQLTNVELEQQFVDYRRLIDSAYCHTLPFGKILRRSFDSVARFYNYPLGLTLPHYIKHLTFHFSAIDWAAPEKIRYSYLLEGLDKEWSIPRPEPVADYRNLPPGNYTFKVKAVGAAQIWGEPFEYTFIILSPWWLTAWAKAFYVLLFLSGLWAIFRYELRRQSVRAEARRLQELDAVKTKLYTNITHEFRTPLTIILGMVDQLKTQVSEHAKEGLQLVKRNGRQLLRLVNQMLDLSKLESGRLELNTEQGDMINFLRYLMESFHSYAESKKIRLHFMNDLKVKTFYMDYDSIRLMHVVSNLLSNAIKFTPEGGDVYLTVNGGTADGKRRTADGGREYSGTAASKLVERSRNERSSFITHHPSLIIRVKDTGIGIPKHKLPYVFDRFYQVDDSPTRKGEGTGIGLTLAKELVKLMGGQIGVQSEFSIGSEFTVTLPVTREKPIQPKAPELLVPLADPAPVKDFMPQAKKMEDRPLMLIVEDNSDLVKYLVNSFNPAYNLEVAYNGRQGIEKAVSLIPDLIITDVMMPEKDGFELCDHLKRNKLTSHIPIIMLTAKVDVDSRLRGLRRGADAYLEKPFLQEELKTRIQALLEQRQRLQAYYLSKAGLSEETQLETPGQEEAKLENAFLTDVNVIIKKHLNDERFTVEQLCRELFIDPSNLYRKLKALTGINPNQYIRSFRLAKAKELLTTTDLPIALIAAECGFAYQNYFSRIFKKETGLTPTKYRMEHRL